MNIPIINIPASTDFNHAKIKIKHESILMDAILGTGTSKPVTGLYLEIIEFINKLKNPVIAIDIPSGLKADTGEIIGPHIKADITVSLSNPKICHLIYPAAEHCGEVLTKDIGIPASVSEKQSGINIISKRDIGKIIFKRKTDSHKGTYGHLLGICGSKGKGGAASLAALAALRVGAGLVTLGIPESLRIAFETGRPEIMTISLPDNKDGTISLEGFDDIMAALKDKKGLMIGPGLTTHDDTANLTRKIIAETNIPVLVDADGINVLAGYPDLVKNRNAVTILTPHPGEMGKIWGISAKNVQLNRLEFVKKTAIDFKSYVVLKGARTIISSPDGELFINTTGNPGMSTAGTGDVLAGMISGFLVQGFSPLNSILSGVFLHGMAGDRAANICGEYSLIAGDLIARIPEAINECIHSLRLR